MVQKSLIVGVRVRPVLPFEFARNEQSKDILRVMDNRMVVVLDPDESKGYLDQLANRSKEKRYTFDCAFSPEATNRTIYDGTVRELVGGVMDGLNGTVFAYGATGSGKTHTMLGTPDDPGLMVLSLEELFGEKQRRDSCEEVDVTCSYLEVYNEVIYDLLIEKPSALELREDPAQGVQVAGLTRVRVETVEEIMGLLHEGNKRRKTDSTSANEASSRSHAVLEIVVRRLAPEHYRRNELRGKLCLVDLAGSERAAETHNVGQKLRDGANINRSLLALANCINALGKRKKRGMAYVPYRNSKLTRLLKDGLSGNSATAMIATVAASSDQYHHSINTLKYADRAKEIKTDVIPNVGTIESHISDYRKIIDNLQAEVQTLKTQLHERPAVYEATSVDDQLSWIDHLASEINENVEERINLQKALFEIEDVNVCNKFELKNLDECLGASDLSSDEEKELSERRENIVENIKENAEAGVRCRHDIDANERTRYQIQQRIEEGMEHYQSASFLKILSTFRLQAVRLQEFQFQMAIRDQIIAEQRSVIRNLWNVMEYSGLDKEAVLEIAHNEGILLEPYLETSHHAPTVGASELLALLNTDRSGARTVHPSDSLRRAEDERQSEEKESHSSLSDASERSRGSSTVFSRTEPPAVTATCRHDAQGPDVSRPPSGKRTALTLQGSAIASSALPTANVQTDPSSNTRPHSSTSSVEDPSNAQPSRLPVLRSLSPLPVRERERRRIQIELLKSLSRRGTKTTSPSK